MLRSLREQPAQMPPPPASHAPTPMQVTAYERALQQAAEGATGPATAQLRQLLQDPLLAAHECGLPCVPALL